METQYLIDVLRQLESFVEQIGPLKYSKVLNKSSSVGAHVRHCLDHSNCLIQGVKMGLLSYDLRQRNTELETNSTLARQTLQAQIKELETSMDFQSTSQEVKVQLQTSTDPLHFSETRSSLGREILFVASHTVHHMALMKALFVQEFSADFSQQFGVALSTQTYQNENRSQEVSN